MARLKPKAAGDTANAFPEDILRHLASAPDTAPPPSAAYLLQELVRRNKVALCHKVFGSEHPETLTALTRLANFYYDAGPTRWGARDAGGGVGPLPQGAWPGASLGRSAR